MTLHVLVQENVNLTQGSQFYAVGMLDISYLLGIRSRGIPHPQAWGGW
jgi:hypothetical protein